VNSTALSGMIVLIHDENDRSTVRFDCGADCDDGSPLHHMVIDTFDVDKAGHLLNKTTIITHDSSIGSPVNKRS